MRFLFKERRFTVMDLDITTTPHGFNVNFVWNIYNRDRLPLELQHVSIQRMPYAFKDWYLARMMSANRSDLESTIISMAKIPDVEKAKKLDIFGMAQIMSLLSYGRNLTDKYWITPAKDTVIRSTRDFGGLNNITIPAHSTYQGMDFHKNGIANDLAYVVQNINEPTYRPNMTYNCPDFCTDGKVKKCITREGSQFFIEKYYDNMSPETLSSYIEDLDRFSSENDNLAPPYETLNRDFSLCGYRTKVMTTEHLNLITLEQLCQSMKGVRKIDLDVLKRVFEDFDLDMDVAQQMLAAAKKYYKKEYGLYPHHVFRNAGFLIEADSKDIIRPVMWM